MSEALNGDAIEPGTVEALIEAYFDWQEEMSRENEMRKAQVTLDENRVEATRLVKVFGKMTPKAIKPHHVYGYLDKRASLGAPAKANKEIALLSAVLEYGRRRGQVEINPCRGIKYNPTKPRTRVVTLADVALAVEIARSRVSRDQTGASTYIVLALCVLAAYLTVGRPQEMRELMRQSIGEEGIKIPIGKRKSGQAVRFKTVLWSPELKSVINEALSLQRTTSLYVFGNTRGQIYTRSGWNTSWTRLMEYCERAAKERGVEFERFRLSDMRPTAVTDRREEGDVDIVDATGHSDQRMINKTYDRRRERKVRATR